MRNRIKLFPSDDRLCQTAILVISNSIVATRNVGMTPELARPMITLLEKLSREGTRLECCWREPAGDMRESQRVLMRERESGGGAAVWRWCGSQRRPLSLKLRAV